MAGSEASDAIDVPLGIVVPQSHILPLQMPIDLHCSKLRLEVGAPVEDLTVLIFDNLDYKTLNHGIFIDQLLCTLRGLGLAEKYASTLQIQLSPGSVVAEIFGPPYVRKHLEALPLQYVEVMGCYARKAPPKAPSGLSGPSFKQSRPVSSFSDATVLSADSSAYDAQANQLLKMWVDTPKSDVETSRSGLDTIANNMVSQFVVGASDQVVACALTSSN